MRLSYLVFALWFCAVTSVHARSISVTGAPELVWSHVRQACNRTDYADGPVRPFLNARNEVVWFAGNSDGYLVTKGTASGHDRLASMERVSCSGRSLGERYDGPIGRRPESYHAGIWLEAPFTEDGRIVYALAHNEFHGEWSGDPRYCDEQFPQNRIILRCDYWNLIAASSFDGGESFALTGLRPDGRVTPAIALPDPYVFDASEDSSATPLAQGMVAQSNIIRWGDYYYVLVLQLVHPAAVTRALNGVCIFRAAALSQSSSWRGWSNARRAYVIEVPRSYPAKVADAAEHCSPALPAHYRFSWSYNLVLRQFIIVGIDTTYGDSGRPAFVYVTATLDPGSGELRLRGAETLLMPIAWLPQWQRDVTVEGAAYPSLLDPSSPELSNQAEPPVRPGDRNFQYSGATPYLYYTRLNPRGASGSSTNRDVVRVPLAVSVR